MPNISQHAVVDPNASLAEDVLIGPFCTVGPCVTLGTGCRLISHVAIIGRTTIGANNIFHPNSVIGGPPQDRKYRGEPTAIQIGDDNVFREACTVHVGTEKGGGVTRVGNNNLFMVNVHLAHDVQISSNCTLANNVMLAGHVHVGAYVIMLGGVGVHHFVTIGDYAFIAGAARIHHDVPPFVKIADDDEIRGLNRIGLERAGFLPADIEALDEATRDLFYRDRPLSLVLAQYDTMNGLNPQVKKLVSFLRQRDQGKYGRYLESLRAK